ncbi:hypothetical protein F5X99DRAFT_64424 [Biscogniauxia marginata]|nr:hypothetical protein F5X99DRAFT_64424 [Biscogniauxia marginata]
MLSLLELGNPIAGRSISPTLLIVRLIILSLYRVHSSSTDEFRCRPNNMQLLSVNKFIIMYSTYSNLIKWDDTLGEIVN